MPAIRSWRKWSRPNRSFSMKPYPGMWVMHGIRMDSGSDSDSKVGAFLPTAYRQVGIVGWRPINYWRWLQTSRNHGNDKWRRCFLLNASENIHLKLKRERSGVHETNQLRRQYGEYHHIFLNWKHMGNGFFNILELILKRSRTFGGKLNITWSRIGVNFINRSFFQKNVL
jgi:hypothetical protein